MTGRPTTCPTSSISSRSRGGRTRCPCSKDCAGPIWDRAPGTRGVTRRPRPPRPAATLPPMADLTSDDDAAGLARARTCTGPTSPARAARGARRGPGGAARVRREDARRTSALVIPLGEPNLAARRRRVAPEAEATSCTGCCGRSRWRYDRLLADQAELSMRLAERVIDLEHEVERLRARSSADRSDGRTEGRVRVAVLHPRRRSFAAAPRSTPRRSCAR